ncbi:SDR family NAD(P)-dependent oxidoreductase [Roseobacter sp. HKCCA0434]|uniref:SDR family NAD(P)-dependent oxidoreductase n=1 Tax=Roseobacter sp. HKCCA0434 TaxID=3079297 RepID=UPI00290582C0|nr:SDR family NAD(P)-dependent oxidoreductase [Roseobacter sp. HKCCA0434]
MDFTERYGGGRALVVGASGAIGAALVEALSAHMEVTGLSRSGDGLDLTDEASVAAAAERLRPGFRLIFDATGALEIDGAGPEKSLDVIDPAAMAAQFALNAIGPALLLKHLAPLMAEDGPSLFASLSARVGSIGDNELGGWYSYRASKAALNQILHTAAIEIARKRPEAVVVALHPGTVTSDLTRKYLGRHPSVAPAEAAENLIRVMGGLRPAQSGGFFDWRGEVVVW